MTKPQTTRDWHDAPPRCKAHVLRLLRKNIASYQNEVRRLTQYLRALLTTVMPQATRQREQRRAEQTRTAALAQLEALQGALAVLRGP